MEKTKRKYNTKIEVEEKTDGVILHFSSSSDTWNKTTIYLSMIVLALAISAGGIFSFIFLLLEVLIVFQWIIGTRERRIVLDAKTLHLERDNAFGTRIPVQVLRHEITDISVFYFRGKYVGWVRIIHPDGNYRSPR